jgi:hypothetical protein
MTKPKPKKKKASVMKWAVKEGDHEPRFLNDTQKECVEMVVNLWGLYGHKGLLDGSIKVVRVIVKEV